MKHSISTFLLVSLLAGSNAALADKPAWAGGAKHQRDEERAERPHNQQARESHGNERFSGETRRLISDYYGTQARAGKCPPGLAKKQNGCLPPGQAKKWAMGRPLPADLRYNELPRDLLLRLPRLPAQQRYVEIAGDVLMIAVGSGMVIDAIEDILR